MSLNQELKVDCLADGEPKPSMRWEKLDSAQAVSAGSMMQHPAVGRQRPTATSASIQFPGGQLEGGKNQLAPSKCREWLLGPVANGRRPIMARGGHSSRLVRLDRLDWIGWPMKWPRRHQQQQRQRQQSDTFEMIGSVASRNVGLPISTSN